MKISISIKRLVQFVGLSGSLVLGPKASASFIPLSTTNYFQDFSSLPKAGQGKRAPEGWAFAEFGPDANNKMRADDGSSSAGGIYSYGNDHSRDRALGSLRGADGTFGIFGAAFQNTQATPINRINISYTGEEWRLGQAGRQDQLQFQYSLNASSLTSGTWLNVPQLDFFTPNLQGVGAHDGTLAANQRQLTSTISFLNIPSGGNLWVRWVDVPVAGGGAEDGLAVDNFSISAVPEMGSTLAGFGALALLGVGFWPFRRSLRGSR